MKIKRLKITEVVKIIKQGGVVVFPTDTVYGLLADATNEKAVKKIFKIKKRPKEKPIPLFVKDIEMAKKFAFINKKQENLLKLFWPGKVTAVLKRPRTRTSSVRGKKNKKLIIYGVTRNTIALRIPNYRLVNVLLKKLDRPLTGTSANISGKPASTKIGEVLRQFKNAKEKPDLILNYGNLQFSLPSIVIDLTGKKTRILRT
jgi:L-threonylcarbamoyladenylate synthase